MVTSISKDVRVAKTPAQWYAFLLGVVLLVVGIAGFFVNSDFDMGHRPPGDELVLFEVNGWHNLVHIASGLIGLLVWRSATGARIFALGFGVIYLAVAIYGFIEKTNFVDLLAINQADNWLHVGIAALGILAGVASRPSTRAKVTV